MPPVVDQVISVQEQTVIFKTPIWEPEGTKFRPYNLATLIAFYIGRFFGRLFRRRKSDAGSKLR